MRIESLWINDVILTDRFIEDYNSVPQAVGDKVLRLLDRFPGTLPNSFRAHKAKDHDLWIGWLKSGKAAYRVLFDVDVETGTLTFMYLENHGKTEKRWKR